MKDTKDTQRRPLPDAEADGIIEGRNAVIEALRVGTAIDKIYLAKGETDKTLGHIASKARDAGIVVVEADRRKLDGMSRTHAHQGVIALAAVREYATVESYIPVARVANIPSLLKELKKQGIWVFGTAADGTTELYSADLKGPAAIVIGSEGDGMTRLAAENCDFLVSIPMKGKISSLNASAAAAILLYEAVRQRG